MLRQFEVSADWVFPVAGEPLANGRVTVGEGRILRVAADPRRVVALGGAALTVLTPGFINTHAHLEFSGFAPVPPTGSMADWLADVVAQTRSHEAMALSPLDRARLGVAEAMRFGTTCVADISATGASLTALQEAGLRGVALLECFHPGHAVDETRLQAIVARFRELQNLAVSDGRVAVGLSPHSPFNVSPAAWRWLLAKLGDHPVLLQTHLAESLDELHWLAGKDAHQAEAGIDELHRKLLGHTIRPEPLGLSPVGYLAHHGLFTAGLSVAHGIQVTAEEQALLASLGVGLAHCPRSNLFLHGRTADLSTAPTDWAIGLGTDSHLSTSDLDLRAEALAACEVHGWSAGRALAALTVGGAEVLGLANQVGQLTAGFSADMVLWSVPVGGEDGPEGVLAVLLREGEVRQAWVAGQRL